MTVITAPDASIVVPVNAQGDLENVLTLLDDLGRYAGPHEFETLLVVNNFAQGRRPPPRRRRRPGARTDGGGSGCSGRG